MAERDQVIDRRPRRPHVVDHDRVVAWLHRAAVEVDHGNPTLLDFLEVGGVSRIGEGDEDAVDPLVGEHPHSRAFRNEVLVGVHEDDFEAGLMRRVGDHSYHLREERQLDV